MIDDIQRYEFLRREWDALMSATTQTLIIEEDGSVDDEDEVNSIPSHPCE